MSTNAGEESAVSPQRPGAHSLHSFRRAATTVEFAVVLPLLLIFIFAGFEFARMNIVRHAAEDAAYEAARNIIVPGAVASEAIAKAHDMLARATVHGATIVVDPSAIDDSTEEITVHVTVPMDSNTWIPPWFTGGRVVQAESRMKTERPPVNTLHPIPSPPPPPPPPGGEDDDGYGDGDNYGDDYGGGDGDDYGGDGGGDYGGSDGDDYGGDDGTDYGGDDGGDYGGGDGTDYGGDDGTGYGGDDGTDYGGDDGADYGGDDGTDYGGDDGTDYGGDGGGGDDGGGGSGSPTPPAV